MKDVFWAFVCGLATIFLPIVSSIYVMETQDANATPWLLLIGVGLISLGLVWAALAAKWLGAEKMLWGCFCLTTAGLIFLTVIPTVRPLLNSDIIAPIFFALYGVFWMVISIRTLQREPITIPAPNGG